MRQAASSGNRWCPDSEIGTGDPADSSLDWLRVVSIFLAMTRSNLRTRTVCFGVVAALALATAVPAWAQEPSSEYVDPTIVKDTPDETPDGVKNLGSEQAVTKKKTEYDTPPVYTKWWFWATAVVATAAVVFSSRHAAHSSGPRLHFWRPWSHSLELLRRWKGEITMTTFSRVTCLVGLATALVVSSSGCDPYTYYNVDVTLQQDGDNAVSDPNTVMQFAGCDVSVYANDEPVAIETGIPLIQRTAGGHEGVCRGTETPRPDLGILDYSTARSSGSLKFKVNIYDKATAGPDQHILVQVSRTPCL